MLTIRKEQMSVLNAYMEEKFKTDVKFYLLNNFTAQVNRMSDSELIDFIGRALDKAKQYNIKTQRDAADFLKILIVYGDNFNKKPEYAWANDILDDHNMAGGTKILQLQKKLGIKT